VPYQTRHTAATLWLEDNCEAIFAWVRSEACCSSCIKVLDFKALQRRFVRFLLKNTSQTKYCE
jgi:hypothetical protein